MTKHLIIAGMTAAALAFTGCNRGDDAATDYSATETSVNETTETAETPAADGAPATDAPATDPATATPSAEEGQAPPAADPAAPVEAAEVTLPGGTKYVDVQVGTGAEATVGSRVTVHYTGTLTNGEKFDSSLDRGNPFSFNLGEGMVIRGWEEGVAGMKVGGKRNLTIPPDQGYGSAATGPIPPNSTLLFEVELLDVQN